MWVLVINEWLGLFVPCGFPQVVRRQQLTVVVVAAAVVAVIVLPREREKQLIDFQRIGSGCQSLKT